MHLAITWWTHTNHEPIIIVLWQSHSFIKFFFLWAHWKLKDIHFNPFISVCPKDYGARWWHNQVAYLKWLCDEGVLYDRTRSALPQKMHRKSPCMLLNFTPKETEFWKKNIKLLFFKVPGYEAKFLYHLIRKSLQNDEDWRLFYCLFYFIHKSSNLYKSKSWIIRQPRVISQ